MRTRSIGLIVAGIVGLLIVIGIFFVVWFIGVGNRIVRLNQATDAAWAQVQNVYQRRLDLIPNLVATVKGAAAHELDVQVGVVSERAKATQVRIDPTDPEQFKNFAQNQAALSSALSRLLVVAENYPQIKANENFLTLQAQIEGSENRITVERNKFNETVLAYNNAVLTFPGSLVAGFRNFKQRPYFTAAEEAQTAPKVDFGAPQIDLRKERNAPAATDGKSTQSLLLDSKRAWLS